MVTTDMCGKIPLGGSGYMGLSQKQTLLTILFFLTFSVFSTIIILLLFFLIYISLLPLLSLLKLILSSFLPLLFSIIIY